MMLLNYSEACARNQQPILAQLKRLLDTPAKVLEIGSGSGQHALFFTEQLPHLHWQPSEIAEGLSPLLHNLAFATHNRIHAPLALDVMADWPSTGFDAAYSANTLHIIGEPEVEAFFTGVGKVLNTGGKLLVYGPFRYQNAYTSPSNAQFDLWLKARDPKSGIRDFEWVNALAAQNGLALVEDIAMPANNQLLVWQATA